MKFCRTKILATLGPASNSPENIEKLYDAGIDAVRLNCSHATPGQLKELIAIIRDIARRKKVSLPILLDLQGPKIRTGICPEGVNSIFYADGSTVEITKGLYLSETEISVQPASLVDELVVGDIIRIKDGLIQVKVESIIETHVYAQVIDGGDLPGKQGVIVPGKGHSIPSLTQKDRTFIDLAVAESIDFISLSFVRKVEDVTQLKQELLNRGARIPIIAKIETTEAVEEIIDILTEADGIMVARGDLAVEISFERLPWVQKRLISEANRAGKLVIVATQMLESMIKNPQPTRAEVMDVANAVFDGADLVMLSGETAMGDYPARAVRVMEQISSESENVHDLMHITSLVPQNQTQALADAAVQVSRHLSCAAIAVLTESGSTAWWIAKLKPDVPIFAFTLNPAIYNRLNMGWGIIPQLISTTHHQPGEHPLAFWEETIQKALLSYDIRHPSTICLVGGTPLGIGQTTNFIKIIELTE